MSLLTVEHLTQQFGGLKAVDDVSLHVEPGELVALIGPNGAGKTTLFNMLTGVNRPTSGQITFTTDKGDVAIGKQRADQVAALGMSRTFQNIRLFSDLNVLDNIKIAMTHRTHENFFETELRLPSFYKKEGNIDAEARELLADFDLNTYARSKAGALPYGLQRRVEIVRALATKPRLLFLDEPAAGMNPEETAELTALIRRIRNDYGTAVILIEHDMSLVMNLAQRIYVLDHGSLIANGTPAEIQSNKAVVAAYLGGDADAEG
ncbi:ABC transporter ATP-binding protein [Lacticaseibacillus pabuli]|uniref:ABC transporter ATP-binding protein n=1 Tax=Lacticaseibacillus pabuli TaxID=3025672 RepID=A0ABY7WUL2_9LACO|nr:ABC transporter ATP-binding protein [Lacticaseibacillus sp. KACC 23028]WDF82835.1 ABC transporter ATP-binding protein [Lacticaseibacillus sp. KACC 23028]